MRKIRKNNAKFYKIAAVSILVILVMTSVAQASVRQSQTKRTGELLINLLKTLTSNLNLRELISNRINNIRNPMDSERQKSNDEDPPILPTGNYDDPFFTWEDDFDTMEWIDDDPDMSYDYKVSGGVAKMDDTYPIWTDITWTRMKPAIITNNAGESLPYYALRIVVDYETEMQSNYDDIRFKHENYQTGWLDYWIESRGASSAAVWVKFPSLPAEQSKMYLFYGNPSVTDKSDFYSVFADWEEEWPNDKKFSFHLKEEGAWDPDIAHGDGKYLVAWEEGTGLPLVRQEIRGSIVDNDGNVIREDFTIRTEDRLTYRNENPSIAYGGGNFFVAWESWIKPLEFETKNIMGRIVSSNGDLGNVIHICVDGINDPQYCQADSHVTFDSVNNRFLVVWEDARIGTYDYNIYGKLYDTNGNPIGDEKNICVESNSQCEPWVTFDPTHKQYMVVWEEGETPAEGPFDIWVGLFDSNLNEIRSYKIADGDTGTDYNFPCVKFCEATQRYLVTWNSGDISDDDWWGNVYGAILDSSGNIVVDTFEIKNGNFVRTEIVVYLSTHFLVSYNGGGSIWGRFISSDGEVLGSDIRLSASGAADADWVNMAVNEGEVFVVWEDERVDYPKPDVYGNIWHLNVQSAGDIKCEFGTEEKLVLNAQITSKALGSDEDPFAKTGFKSWEEFRVDYDGSITFDILDGSGKKVIISDASSGEDLSGINPTTYPAIRLRAHFTRSNPSYTPTLDKWTIIYEGKDDTPPVTTYTIASGTPGENEWYKDNVKIELDADDGLYGIGVDKTYFKIGEYGPTQEYDKNWGIKLPPEDPNDLYGQWEIYYWSVDKSGNTESTKGPVKIKIDKAGPYCEITEPADGATLNGEVFVTAKATDVGSGIRYVKFDVGSFGINAEKGNPLGGDYYGWTFDSRNLKRTWKHIIARAYDYAGHMCEYSIWTYFKNPYSYNNNDEDNNNDVDNSDVSDDSLLAFILETIQEAVVGTIVGRDIGTDSGDI